MNQPGDDQTRSHTILTTGSTVLQYRIVEKIGAGGMGEVFLADDTKLGRRVALKFLPAHQAEDSAIRARFTREAQAAAKLDHPNIVTIHEVSEFNGRPFFAMQYVDGKTLSHYAQEFALPVSKVISLIAQLCDGLARAHSAGVTHRDIKSANIIVDKDLRPKILDFGLATFGGGDGLTKAGSTLGTVAYMSPEQAQGREMDRRSDLFSLGVVMYELLAGQNPFKRNNDAATLHAIVSEQAEPLTRYKSDLSPEFQRIVSKALAKNPSERYQSADDLGVDLRTLSRLLESGDHTASGRVATSKPSIAVLPFSNMSADPENEYFSDGLTEELLNVLAKNPELKVTGRTSCFAFKGKQEDLRSIGQKLGVGTILEGSVRKAGSRVRITTQLVSVTDGFHLWSETFDRVLDDIFAVQDEIAQSVSKAMHVALVGVVTERKPVNPESYALTLRAHQSQLLMNAESLESAVELYKKAIEIDAENAKAWAGLSLTYAIRDSYGHSDHQIEYPLAKQAALKSLALDDQLAEAHIAMAWVYSALELKVRDGYPHAVRAYDLEPNKCDIVAGMALWELLFGNFDNAIKLSRKSVELDPLNPTAWRELSRILVFAGQIDESLEIANRVVAMSPNMTTLQMGRAAAFILKGDYQSALEAAEKEKAAGYRYCCLALARHSLGELEKSAEDLELLKAEGDQWGFQIAMVYAWQKDADAAFEWLERAYEVHDAGVPLAKVQPFLRNLHSDRRWPVFLKKIGLAD